LKLLKQIVLVSSGTAILLLGSPQTHGIAGEACRELIQNKCTSCHFVKHICPKIEQGQGILSWKWTIRAMVKEGLVVTDPEEDRLVDCLANPDEKVKSLCPANK